MMEEIEAEEAKYRENWLARQSRATQAIAAQIGADVLKESGGKKESGQAPCLG